MNVLDNDVNAAEGRKGPKTTISLRTLYALLLVNHCSDYYDTTLMTTGSGKQTLFLNAASSESSTLLPQCKNCGTNTVMGSVALRSE